MKIYHGSCHCGAVRFECGADLAAGTSRCNCSICSKTRFWKVIVGTDAFRLLSGGEALTEYHFGSRTVAHLFCSRCGVKPFGHGEIDGNRFYAINVACLDDVAPEQLAALPVNYEDGRHDRWDAPPAETGYL
ncbi:aldehyde-activating protein [Alkalilimnicola ehrlichii]|uniref:Aldehyde-activating protein n=1 Tax=Alkalilimnicola ehrlichii TaxID=351052 RepID=A0A3E0WQK1_9GAMM|nr:GFA family protein [Alkalilimnicola ehrlichii]RFA27336.1 aldehyde-activating protein [Alkalilimnicola ehrlichii]RFA34441.1 aldehyde-activating protein [Alkalilimnicola ehrlichii]